MIPNGLIGFYERGGYLLPYEGGPVFLPGQYPVFAVGEAKALGSRGGGFQECSGVPGQVAIGDNQLAWAVKWAGPVRYSDNYVGNIYLPDIETVSWKERVLRVAYMSHVERIPGLLLVRFRSDLAVDLVKEGLAAQPTWAQIQSRAAR